MTDSVGDQHKQNAATTNPFEDQETTEHKRHITPYTAQEIATLQSRLDKQLGPEYISSRPGAAGQKIHYLAAEKVINLANEIFGFNGWSSSVQNIQIDFVDEHPETRKISLGLSVIVRVTLKDGTYHEDVGYGHIENCKGKAAAFEKAKKEGTTDALKRALKTFGNVLGNCVYDKEYVSKVTKMKVGNGKWDEKNLHRHPSHAPRKVPEVSSGFDQIVHQPATSNDVSFVERASFIDIAEFEDAEFDDDDFDHPDRVVLPADTHDTPKTLAPGRRVQQLLQGSTTTPSRPPNGPQSVMRHPTVAPNIPNPTVAPQRVSFNGTTHGRVEESSSDGKDHQSSPGIPSQHFARQHGEQAGRTSAFYSARAAEIIDADNNITISAPDANLRFNLRNESPSIRKTAGIDHNKSGKLLRDGLQPEGTVPRKDSIEPQPDPGRKVGAPPVLGGQSPATRPAGTSAYRPPTRRGPDNTMAAPPVGGPGGVDRVLTAAKRTPLGDVINVQPQHNVAGRTDDGVEAKRPKLTGLENNTSVGNNYNAAGGEG